MAMWKAFAAIAFAYLVACWVAVVVGTNLPSEHPIAVAFAADAAATLAIFVFSFLFRNSSFYDPYWSVAPFPIAVYWMVRAESIGVDPTRQQLVLLLLAAWGVRLTWNWARGWTGLGHEDWRYQMLAERTGPFYWAVSLAGIHMMPTIWVFLGCLPLYPALSVGVAPLGLLDGVAFLVTATAIAIEARADKQLLRFRRAGPPADALLDTGVWSWSRHPNYFGEILFWWGLFLFGIAAAPAWWWTGIGALCITLMFRFVSLPMIETRMLERRPAFAAYQDRVSIVLPWPPKLE
jgi:steroid 5-alpha reductase family enzyme